MEFSVFERLTKNNKRLEVFMFNKSNNEISHNISLMIPLIYKNSVNHSEYLQTKKTSINKYIGKVNVIHAIKSK